MFYIQLNNCSVMSEHFVFRGLPNDSTSVLKAEPGKLYIKRRKPGILFISLAVVSLFRLAIMTLFLMFVLIQSHKRRDSKSATSS